MIGAVLSIVGMISMFTRQLVAQGVQNLKYPVPESPRQIDEQCQTKQAFFQGEVFKYSLQDTLAF